MTTMQAIKDKVKVESNNKSEEYVASIAQGVADEAMNELYKARATTSGKNNLINKTKERLYDRGWSEEVAKAGAQYAVEVLSAKIYPAKL